MNTENTEIFTGKAEVYLRGRPSYPDSAIDYVCNLVSNNAVFADIGAGTGKFTELIARRGYSVFAVEPNHDMKLHLTSTLENYTNAKIIEAPAEFTTLPKMSVDIITVAQALHWFELNLFRSECKRICRPGAVVVAIYNVKKNRSRLPVRMESSTKSFFINPVVKKFLYSEKFTRERWLDFMSTRPSDPLPTDDKYESHITNMIKEFDRECVNGLLEQQFETYVFSEELL